jgi:hypothetical protein
MNQESRSPKEILEKVSSQEKIDAVIVVSLSQGQIDIDTSAINIRDLTLMAKFFNYRIDQSFKDSLEKRYE